LQVQGCASEASWWQDQGVMAGKQRGLSRERVVRRRRFRMGAGQRKRARQSLTSTAHRQGARADGGGEAAALDTSRD